MASPVMAPGETPSPDTAFVRDRLATETTETSEDSITDELTPEEAIEGDIEKQGDLRESVQEHGQPRRSSINRAGERGSLVRQKFRFNTFSKPIDTEDTEYMEERLEYDIAWSINPFVHNPYHKRHHSNHGSGSSTPHQNADSPDGPAFITVQQVRVGAAMSRDKARRASVDAHALSMFDNIGTPKASYAELFYDLFFVASLTSFGIKHEITQDQAIASYVAFFTVLWWVWTSQSFYDVRFETGDVIHRAFKFAQLLLLAAFAAFAGKFDVYYGFPNDYGLEDDHNPFTTERSSGFFAFRGMTIVYIISRLVLAIQYLLLYHYARRKAYPASRQFLVQVASLLISGALWLGSYFLEGEDANEAMRIAKFGLWYGGIAIEFATSIVTWACCRVTGFRKTHLTERFATLTLLIIGEGVIGYAIALQGIIGGIGFGPPSGLAIVMVCLIIYLLWVYYFSTFNENAQYNVPRAYGWAYLHYPFHVSLILILIACTSLMIYANVANAINGFGSGGEDYQASILATVYNNATSLTIGNTTVGWDYNDVNNGTFLNNLTEQQLAVLVFDACSRIFQSYNLVVPAEFTDLLDQLADGQVPPEQGVYEFLLESLAYRFYVSAVYYVVACGSLLLFGAGMLLVQQWPRDRMAWIGIYTRFILGAGFVALIAIWPTDSGATYLDSDMLLPTLVIILVVVVLVDFISTIMAVRKYQKAGKLPPHKRKYSGWMLEVGQFFQRKSK